MTAALSDLVVVDFTRVLSGPFATMVLGDLGAEVIKVERPDGGDETREWGPPVVGGMSAYYVSVNRNKKSICLDLDTREGVEIARALIMRADILVENFRPGTMARFGLDYCQVRRVRPKIIYCSISGFGETLGRDLPAYDLIVQALGGLMSLTGYRDLDPVKVGVPIVDILTGLYAVIAILGAVRYLSLTGNGQYVRVDLFSCLLASLVNHAAGYLATGEVPTRMGNQHPNIAPYEVFRTADRCLVVAVGNDAQFSRLCSSIGLEVLLEDRDFATNLGRVANRKRLVTLLEEKLVSASAEHWVNVLRHAGVPSGLVNDVGEAFGFAQELGLDVCLEMRNREGVVVPQVASPLRLMVSPVEYRLPPPMLGEHNDEVKEWLWGSKSLGG